METMGASWFDIGTAMHTVYERGIKAKWKTAATYRKHAVEEVLNLVTLGQDITGGGDNYLVSRHRPIDTPSLTRLATNLADSFFENVIENPPFWLPNVYGDGWKLEENVRVASTEWEFEGGASTTIDAYYDGPLQLLVDWKTGRSRRSDPRQLQFYRYLLEHNGKTGFGETPTPWGVFFHAEWGRWQIVDEYDADAVERLIATSQVLKKAKPRAMPSWLCDYCTARKVCPAFADDKFDKQVLQAQAEVRQGRYEYLVDPD